MPNSKKVGAHCPMNVESWCLLITLRRREIRIEPTTAHKKRSEGSFAVCCSRLRATGPSAFTVGFVIYDKHSLWDPSTDLEAFKLPARPSLTLGPTSDLPGTISGFTR